MQLFAFHYQFNRSIVWFCLSITSPILITNASMCCSYNGCTRSKMEFAYLWSVRVVNAISLCGSLFSRLILFALSLFLWAFFLFLSVSLYCGSVLSNFILCCLFLLLNYATPLLPPLFLWISFFVLHKLLTVVAFSVCYAQLLCCSLLSPIIFHCKYQHSLSTHCVQFIFVWNIAWALIWKKNSK